VTDELPVRDLRVFVLFLVLGPLQNLYAEFLLDVDDTDIAWFEDEDIPDMVVLAVCHYALYPGYSRRAFK
jgi:hypothetical protein